MPTVNDLISLALNEVGYLEKKSNSQLYDKTANAGSNNYTKYGKEMHDIYPSVMDYPAYWCDAFVDWCFYKTFGVSNAKGLLGGNFDDYTPNSVNLYKSKNAYFKRGTTTPQVGDQIFFNNGTRVCHTGIVYKVDSSKVYTIEGNTSGGSTVVANGGGVAKKSYNLNYSRIDGYGRPPYAKYNALPNKEPSVVIKSIKNVIANCSVLNIRSLPNTTGKIVGNYKAGYPVNVYEVSSNGWFKTDTGWISGKYVSTTTAVITASSLNVRSGPGTSNPVIGNYKNGETVKLLNFKNNWYLTEKGWISGKYIR